MSVTAQPQNAPAAPPTPPAPVAPGAFQVPASALPGAELSRQQVLALQSRRTELRSQLEELTERRRELAEELHGAHGASRGGIESRLAATDERISRTELEIDAIGQQLSSSGVVLTSAGTQPPPDFPFRVRDVDPEPIIISFTLFVLSPIAIAISRLIWKRGSRTIASAPVGDSARLERVEQAIDAIAIEMERVSEGQRFVTRILSERGNALGVGQQPAEPVRVPLSDASRVR